MNPSFRNGSSGLPVGVPPGRAFVLAVSVLASACVAPKLAVEPGRIPAHHAGKGFRNVHETPRRGGFGAVLRWKLGWGPKEAPPVKPEDVPPFRPDVVEPDFERIRRPDPSAVQVTWIGHATFLIQAGGLAILTDPVFNGRPSPVPFIGPRRQSPLGLRFEDLPPIDAAVISHDHFDHLDAPTIRRLGPGVRYFVPLGLGEWFGRMGFLRVSELDWGQTSFIGGVLFHCAPAQHFSGRGPFGFNRRLWSGWVIETPSGTVYFAGDTGYSPHFREIREKFGPIDLSILPIGAYRPRWFMRPMHMDPAEAVRAHRDLESRRSVGAHWGTFSQSDEPLGEPPVYLKQAAGEAGLKDGEFTVLRLGETLVLKRSS